LRELTVAYFVMKFLNYEKITFFKRINSFPYRKEQAEGHIFPLWLSFISSVWQYKFINSYYYLFFHRYLNQLSYYLYFPCFEFSEFYYFVYDC